MPTGPLGDLGVREIGAQAGLVAAQKAVAEPGEGSSWMGSVFGVLGGLSSARLVAQFLGLGWFILAGAKLSLFEFGLMSSGLMLVFVLGAVSDLGLVRTVSVRVGANPSELPHVFLAAARVRILGGVLSTAIATAAIAAFLPTIGAQVGCLAGATALASGITEIGFSAHRAAGIVRVESRLLVYERLLFIALGVMVLAMGGGAIGVLWAYLVSNSMSAAVMATAILSGRMNVGHQGQDVGVPDRAVGEQAAVAASPPVSPPVSPPASLPKARSVTSGWMALVASLSVLAPRTLPLILILGSRTEAVGSFLIAQKPAETLLALTAAVAAPILPLLSFAHRSTGALATSTENEGSLPPTLSPDAPTLRRAGQLVEYGTKALAIAVIWIGLLGGPTLRQLFGWGDLAEMIETATLLGGAALLSNLRNLPEFALIAQGRARTVAMAQLVGIGAILCWCGAVGISRGIDRLAIGVVLSEALVLMLLARSSGRAVVGELVRVMLRSALWAGLLYLTLLASFLVTSSPASPLVLVMVASGICAVAGGILLLQARAQLGQAAGASA